MQKKPIALFIAKGFGWLSVAPSARLPRFHYRYFIIKILNYNNLL